jgi:hypothetical protein
MKIYLKRFEKTGSAILGKLYIEEDYFCYILENPTKHLNPGIFTVEFEWSPAFNRMLYEVKDDLKISYW